MPCGGFFITPDELTYGFLQYRIKINVNSAGDGTCWFI